MSRLPDLEAWAVFARVAEIGSFARTAEEFGISKATVSKAVGRLEERIGASLFNRTSRQLSLTDIGRIAAVSASQILADATAVEAAAMSQSSAPRGLVRIAAPMSFGVKYLAGILPALAFTYPDVVVDLHLNDAIVDLIGGGFDLVLRIAALADSSLRARRVCDIRRRLVGAPAYFRGAGRPTHPQDLVDHACLGYSYLPTPGRWQFRHKSGEDVTVAVTSPLSINNASAIMPALLHGMGVAVQPDFVCWEELNDGTLEVAMPDWIMSPIALHVLTPPSSHRPACVAAVGDFLVRNPAPPQTNIIRRPTGWMARGISGRRAWRLLRRRGGVC